MNVENVHLLSNHWKIKEVSQLLLNYKEQTRCRYNKVQLTFNIKDITKVTTTIMVMTLMKVITTTRRWWWWWRWRQQRRRRRWRWQWRRRPRPRWRWRWRWRWRRRQWRGNRELKQRRWRRQGERQKSNRFKLAKQQLCTWITLFCTFLFHHRTTATWKYLISRFVNSTNLTNWTRWNKRDKVWSSGNSLFKWRFPSDDDDDDKDDDNDNPWLCAGDTIKFLK